MGKKVIITAAVTGSVPTRKNNPNIPYTPEEVAEEAYKAYLAGASVIHLHARNPETGAPISGKESVPVFKEYITLIKEKCDAICQITTGGGATTISGLEQMVRLQPVIECMPEMASLNTGSMNFGSVIFPNPPDLIEMFAKKMLELNVKPEIECYELGRYDIISIDTQDSLKILIQLKQLIVLKVESLNISEKHDVF